MNRDIIAFTKYKFNVYGKKDIRSGRDSAVVGIVGKSKSLDFPTMLIFWSLVRNSVVLAVYLLFSVACFLTVHEHSFRALIYANLLSCDGTKESLYYQQLSSPIRATMLNQGLHYLSKEKDTTGFSSQYGWVHAFAHGGDLLTEVICHPSFPKSDIAEAFEIIGKIFKRVEIRFTNDEDWRLARAFYEPILRGKIESSLLTAWLQTVEFPLKEANDFHKFSNFRSCLLEIYLQLDCHNLLQDDLKKIIQSFYY